ncbi:MAG: TonB-dependent receptor plug domain-containing protein, partial [Acidobacteria bacterium]|nr:TonB-dependent receptor plug domain-containing protein [Acidobacteriota bacterium]
MKTRMLVLVIGSILLSLLPASPALAQDTPGAAVDGVRTFFPADFAQFAPRTALDMLSRVPGFTIRQGGQERGLGQASVNVVINGQRISGKSNDVITELSRIPAQNVERIEIVDGATLDVPGLSGQVANVIVISKGISGQFGYRPEFREYNTDPLFTRFEVSVGGTRGPVEYTVGLSNPSSRSGASGPTWIYSPDGTLIEDRDDHWKGNAEQPRLSARLVFDGPGSAVGNLNLLYGRLYFDYIETGIRSRPGQPDRERVVTVDETGGNYEVGGDYEFELGRGHLKLIGVARGWIDNDLQTDVLTTFADGSPMSGSRFMRSGDEGEMIGRSEYRWKDVGGAEWQISAEGAFNSLDNVSQLFILDSEGEYEEIPLPGGSARVEEDRYEVMGTYGRSLSPSVGMKLSIGGEYSELSQVGNAGGTRNFFRPKGEISAAWQPTEGTDLNFKLARRVGQLNFYDFLASVDLQDDQANAANPDLVPQQSWDLDLEGVRELGARGTTTLRLYGRLIDDIIDYIPIGATGESPGNLDQATVYGIESRSTFNLDTIGFTGARLDFHAQWQESEVEDPLTGEKRPISNSLEERSSLALRHDVPGSDWAWGGADGSGVRVAVVDSGIDADHPDLGDCVQVDDGIALHLDRDGEVVQRRGPHRDAFGHGTACAGIIHGLAPG